MNLLPSFFSFFICIAPDPKFIHIRDLFTNARVASSFNMNTFAVIVLMSVLVLQSHGRPTQQGSFDDTILRQTRSRNVSAYTPVPFVACKAGHVLKSSNTCLLFIPVSCVSRITQLLAPCKRLS